MSSSYLRTQNYFCEHTDSAAIIFGNCDLESRVQELEVLSCKDKSVFYLLRRDKQTYKELGKLS